MKKNYTKLPVIKKPMLDSSKHVALIGCGNFAFSNIAYYLHKNYGNVIRAAMDININHAASLYEAYSLDYYTNNAEEIINDPKVDLIFIASNHASHADYAIKALQAGKSVHIEKPHVVNEQQLINLCQTMQSTHGKVTLGFNRPKSKIGRMIKKHMDAQSGSAMINWFIAGHEIEADHWYFKEEEGGRILGNLCHWIDFTYHLVASSHFYPVKIVPSRAQQSDCDISVSYLFNDGSIATITFSAKGHTFEGVREKLNAHRGNVLVAMDDFQKLVIDNVDKKHTLALLHRDHGHEAAIKDSYSMSRAEGQLNSGCEIKYVWQTGQLFLKTKEALDHNKVITVLPFEQSFIKHAERTSTLV